MDVFQDGQQTGALFDVAELVEECGEDIEATQNEDAVNDAITGATVICADHAMENNQQNNPALQNVLCLNACSGHGECLAAECSCVSGTQLSINAQTAK